MEKIFYHVFVEYDDNVTTDWGYFHSFENAYKACSERNEELGNDSGDYSNLYDDVKEWGSTYCGCFTIKKCEFDD